MPAVGRAPQIDRDAVLRAGLALADEAGLDAVTMAAVAARLGVTPMALYRHVANKGDLLDGLVEVLLEEIPRLPAELAWDRQLAAAAAALRRVAKRHPAVFPLLLARPARTERALAVRAGVHAALRAAGVAPEHVERVERIVSTLVMAHAASEVNGRFAAHSRTTLAADHHAIEQFVMAGLTPFLAP